MTTEGCWTRPVCSSSRTRQPRSALMGPPIWVAVKEFKLSYYIGKPYCLPYLAIMVTEFKFLTSNLAYAQPACRDLAGVFPRLRAVVRDRGHAIVNCLKRASEADDFRTIFKEKCIVPLK